MEEQRNAVKEAFLMLREHYPGLPAQLRDFQVEYCACERLDTGHFVIILQADIVRCAIDDDETCHIMGALPTGYGKSLPMLVTGLLMPPGKYGLDTQII